MMARLLFSIHFLSIFFCNGGEDCLREGSVRVASSNRLFRNQIVTPTNIRSSCDVFFGPIFIYEMKNEFLDEFHHRNLQLLVECLQPGAVICVQPNWLRFFFSHYYAQVSVPFVLVTHGISDEPNPNGIGLSEFTNPDSKIIHWYAQNCDNNIPDRKRFSCLMIGICDNDVWRQGDHTGESYLVEIFPSQAVINANYPYFKPATKDDSYDLLVPPMNMGTHSSRRRLWEHFCGRDQLEGKNYLQQGDSGIIAMCMRKKVSGMEMYATTAKSVFVVSPYGMGLDCYRTWETLYLGAYPVVQSSSLDELYKDLPVLIVKDWEDVTFDLLAQAHGNFSRTQYSFDKLRISYWDALFRSHRNFTRFDYKVASLASSVAATMTRLGVWEGDLIRGAEKLIYVIENSTKRAVSGEAFEAHQWSFGNVKRLAAMDINLIPNGPDLNH